MEVEEESAFLEAAVSTMQSENNELGPQVDDLAEKPIPDSIDDILSELLEIDTVYSNKQKTINGLDKVISKIWDEIEQDRKNLAEKVERAISENEDARDKQFKTQFKLRKERLQAAVDLEVDGRVRDSLACNLQSQQEQDATRPQLTARELRRQQAHKSKMTRDRVPGSTGVRTSRPVRPTPRRMTESEPIASTSSGVTTHEDQTIPNSDNNDETMRDVFGEDSDEEESPNNHVNETPFDQEPSYCPPDSPPYSPSLPNEHAELGDSPLKNNTSPIKVKAEKLPDAAVELSDSPLKNITTPVKVKTEKMDTGCDEIDSSSAAQGEYSEEVRNRVMSLLNEDDHEDEFY